MSELSPANLKSRLKPESDENLDWTNLLENSDFLNGSFSYKASYAIPRDGSCGANKEHWGLYYNNLRNPFLGKRSTFNKYYTINIFFRK